MNKTWLSKSNGNINIKSSAKRALPGLSTCSDTSPANLNFNENSFQGTFKRPRKEQQIQSVCQETPLPPVKSHMNQLAVDFLPPTPMPLTNERNRESTSIPSENKSPTLLVPSVNIPATPQSEMQQTPFNCVKSKVEEIPKWVCDEKTPVALVKETPNSRRSAYFMSAAYVPRADPVVKKEPVIPQSFSFASKHRDMSKSEWMEKPIKPRFSNCSLRGPVHLSPPSAKRSMVKQDAVMSVVSSRPALIHRKLDMFKQPQAGESVFNGKGPDTCNDFTQFFLKEFAGYETKLFGPGVRPMNRSLQEHKPLEQEKSDNYQIKKEKSNDFDIERQKPEPIFPSISYDPPIKRSPDVSINSSPDASIKQSPDASVKRSPDASAYFFEGEMLDHPVFTRYSPHRQPPKVSSSPPLQVSKAMRILEADQPSVKLESLPSSAPIQLSTSKVMKPFLDNSFDDSEIDDEELDFGRETFFLNDQANEKAITDKNAPLTDLHDFLAMGTGRKWKESESMRGLQGLQMYNVDMSLEALAMLASMKASRGRFSMTYLLNLYRGKLDVKHMKMAQNKHDDTLPFFRRGEPLNDEHVKIFLQALVNKGLLSEKRELKKPFNKECLFYRILPGGEEYVNGPNRERFFVNLGLNKAVKRKRSMKATANAKGHNVSFKVDPKDTQSSSLIQHFAKVEEPRPSNSSLFPTDIPENSGGKAIFFGATEGGETVDF